VTAPEDPFRSPTPGATPPGRDPADRPEPYRDPAGGSPAYGNQPYGDPAGAPGGTDPGYGGQQYGAPAYGSQQYGSQPYGAGPAFGEQRPSPRNGLGIAALVLGILALLTGLFFIGGVLGIAAIVLGVLGRRRAKRGEATNGGMAIAGIVLGVLGLLLTALAVFGAVSLFGSDEFSNLTECLDSAGSDRAAQQQCQTDFEDQVVGG
jgi:hypothetical protein